MISGRAAGGAGPKKVAELRKSCDLCCSRKRRCDGDGVNTCTLCASKSIVCTYSKKERRGPKPKPKRSRDSSTFAIDGDASRSMPHGSFGTTGGTGAGGGSDSHTLLGGEVLPNGSSILDGVEWQQGSPPPPKTARVSDVMTLSPPIATGMLGLEENQHLNSFFSGFGACTQIVQEDEIRGAMIHILSGGQIGMPALPGEDDMFPSPVFSNDNGETKADNNGNDNTTLATTNGGSGPGNSWGWGGSGSGSGSGGGGDAGEQELKQRTQRGRLAAGVACLWAGVGVGAMLCGQTAEATRHYAEYAREAIKGCYDVVSEEVLRAFLCLAHMHSFREDFSMFFRYSAMAKDVAASLDRQEEEPSPPRSSGGYRRGHQKKGCSEPAKFLLKCFDALGAFLELESEEIGSPYEGTRTPFRNNSFSSKMSSSSSSSVAANASSFSSSSASTSASSGGTSGKDRQTPAGGHMTGGDFVAAAVAAAAAEAEEENRGAPPAKGKGKARSIRSQLPNNHVSALAIAAAVAADPRSGPSSEEEQRFPGLSSAVRVQECLSFLGDNPVAQHLGSFAMSLGGSSSGGGSSCSSSNSRTRIMDEFTQNERASGNLQGSSTYADSACGVTRDEETKEAQEFPSSGSQSNAAFPLQMNQVLFVGDTRILEVSMGVDCSCISVMCKAVAGVAWSEVAADASVVANAADTILVPVLSSPSISRSVCAVKLLADAAFAHLCLGATDNALRAVRRFCAILDEFPGIMRFPPWRHCFHWMAGMLESAGLHKLYEGLRTGLNGLCMKRMQSLPEFGSAHDIMCKCNHFRCQATHRALAECARRDPYGAFQVPPHCPRWGVAATAAAAAANSARSAPEATAWAEKIKEAVKTAARKSHSACSARPANTSAAAPAAAAAAATSRTSSAAPITVGSTASRNDRPSSCSSSTAPVAKVTATATSTIGSSHKNCSNARSVPMAGVAPSPLQLPSRSAPSSNGSSESHSPPPPLPPPPPPSSYTTLAGAATSITASGAVNPAAPSMPAIDATAARPGGGSAGIQWRHGLARQAEAISKSAYGGGVEVGGAGSGSSRPEHVEEGSWFGNRGIGNRPPPSGLGAAASSFDAFALSQPQRQSSFGSLGSFDGEAASVTPFEAPDTARGGHAATSSFTFPFPSSSTLSTTSATAPRRAPVRSVSEDIAAAFEVIDSNINFYPSTSNNNSNHDSNHLDASDNIGGSVAVTNRSSSSSNSSNNGMPIQGIMGAGRVSLSSSSPPFHTTPPMMNSNRVSSFASSFANSGATFGRSNTSAASASRPLLQGGRLPSSGARAAGAPSGAQGFVRPLPRTANSIPAIGGGSAGVGGREYGATTARTYADIFTASAATRGGIRGEVSIGGSAAGAAAVSVAEQQNIDNRALWAVLCETPEPGGADMDVEMSDMASQGQADLEGFAADLVGILSDAN